MQPGTATSEGVRLLLMRRCQRPFPGRLEASPLGLAQPRIRMRPQPIRPQTAPRSKAKYGPPIANPRSQRQPLKFDRTSGTVSIMIPTLQRQAALTRKQIAIAVTPAGRRINKDAQPLRLSKSATLVSPCLSSHARLRGRGVRPYVVLVIAQFLFSPYHPASGYGSRTFPDLKQRDWCLGGAGGGRFFV